MTVNKTFLLTQEFAAVYFKTLLVFSSHKLIPDPKPSSILREGNSNYEEETRPVYSEIG